MWVEGLGIILETMKDNDFEWYIIPISDGMIKDLSSIDMSYNISNKDFNFGVFEPNPAHTKEGLRDLIHLCI